MQHMHLSYSGNTVSRALALLEMGALDEASVALREGVSSLRGIAGSDCEYLAAAQWAEVATATSFADVDTPEDLQRLGLG